MWNPHAVAVETLEPSHVRNHPLVETVPGASNRETGERISASAATALSRPGYPPRRTL